MSSPYAPRHRGGVTRRRTAPSSSSGFHLAKALRRPAISSALLLTVLATTAAGYQAADQRQTGSAGFTVSTEAIAQANELADTRIEDSARLAADRNASNTRVAEAQEKARVAAIAAATARREAAAKVARDKARKAAEVKRQAAIADAQADPRAAARALLGDYGFSDSQFSCLDKLWEGESNWRWHAENPSSGAYGIPQSLPASKMATVAGDYRTNPVTQIKWGLEYIQSTYGTPCGAWDAWQSRSPHWY